MNIEKYKLLISSLPVRQQCFETRRTTWEKAETQTEWLKILNDNLFGDNKTLSPL